MKENDKSGSLRWMGAVTAMVDKGFLFIHINKTGGTSVRQALGVSGYEHLRAVDVLGHVGECTWSRVVTFSTIRNPWDRLVSMYHWRVKTNQTGLAGSGMPFAEWLDLCLRKQDRFYVKNPLMLAPQTYWLTDSSGTLLVQTLLRFEHLADDFAAVCSSLGFKDLQLPHLKQTERKHYSLYFSARDIDLVSRVYSKDIDAFGYRFEKEPA